jgi:hypothetical protein
MYVNAVLYCDKDVAVKTLIREKSALNLKRAFMYDKTDWFSDEAQSPYFILDLQETKTTWHPIENIGGTKAGY